jgi:formate dehydrogenase subunit delta
VNPAKLIQMANRIGDFFAAMPDREQAIGDVAGHIERTWEPRMIRDLRAHIAHHGDAELSDIVRAALARPGQ